MYTHRWKEEAVFNLVSGPVLKPCIIHNAHADGLSRPPICLLSNTLNGGNSVELALSVHVSFLEQSKQWWQRDILAATS